MRQTILVGAMVILGVGLTACVNKSNTGLQVQNMDTTTDKSINDMKNLISIVEIPTTDFSRAASFYEKILDIKIEEVQMADSKLGLFPNADGSVFVQLIQGSDYKPSSDGTIIYLNGGDDLQTIADKVKANGGKIVVPKSEIGPDMGFFAIFTDTEGNKVGLHSTH